MKNYQKRVEVGLRNTLKQFKKRAEKFLDNDIRAVIIDINNNSYFCDILLVGSKGIYVQVFKGLMKGQKVKIFWKDIMDFEEHKERGKSEKM